MRPVIECLAMKCLLLSYMKILNELMCISVGQFWFWFQFHLVCGWQRVLLALFVDWVKIGYCKNAKYDVIQIGTKHGTVLLFKIPFQKCPNVNL